MRMLFRGFEETNNQKGQFAIEAVLLLTLLIGIFLFTTRTLREKQVIQKLVDKSVVKVAKMTEQGTWREECSGIGGRSKQSAAKCHPNSIHRSLSSAPE